MSRLSNSLIAIINTLTFLVSLPIIIVAGLLNSGSTKVECVETLRLPFLTFAVVLFTVSLLGMIGSCCKVSSVLRAYLVIMLFLILGLLCFTIFLFVTSTTKSVVKGPLVTSPGGNQPKQYSAWLVSHVAVGHSWDKVRNCMVDFKLCNSFQKSNEDLGIDGKSDPFQSGCCMPPPSCGFTYINETFWEVPTKSKPNGGDCTAWSNKDDLLCYNCESCKIGTLEFVSKQGKALTKFNISILVFLILVYVIACCAFKANRAEKYKGYSYP